MNIEKYIKTNFTSLEGKTIAITGSTGGIGKELCSQLCSLGASLILLDRNEENSRQHGQYLTEKYGSEISYIRVDLEDISSVKEATNELLKHDIDILIHNAGAYSIPRRKSDLGYDNVFQINFLSPYYITKKLLPMLKKRGGKVISVGSIAHNYSKTDKDDVDFSLKKQASKVYGNAKRYLMFALNELFKNEGEVSLSVTHPGITFTNITAHYPKVIFAVIKHPMKVIFMKPKKASVSILKGVFDTCCDCEWIGPRFFDVWGLPSKKTLKSTSSQERKHIFLTAERLYEEMDKTLNI